MLRFGTSNAPRPSRKPLRLRKVKSAGLTSASKTGGALTGMRFDYVAFRHNKSLAAIRAVDDWNHMSVGAEQPKTSVIVDRLQVFSVERVSRSSIDHFYTYMCFIHGE
jgi:hypothetical protein